MKIANALLCCLCCLPATLMAEKSPNIDYLSLPLVFIENAGQWHDSARYAAKCGAATFWFTDEGAVYEFGRKGEAAGAWSADRLKVSFVGMNSTTSAIGTDLGNSYTNYLIGNDSTKWHTFVPNFAMVIYKNVYDGIDLEYFGNGKILEYDFIISPDSDPSQIAVRYDGATSLTVNGQGELEVSTGSAVLYERIPLVYQVTDKGKVPIACEFELLDERTFTFRLPTGYDNRLALVIDPQISYRSYLGDTALDDINGMAVDTAGRIYLTGETWSSTFPTQGAIDATLGGSSDVFVTCLTPSGATLNYSTYIGGTLFEVGRDITVDALNRAVIVGSTTSTAFSTVAAYDATHNGADDGFLCRLTENGGSLLFSTYYGGGGTDRINRVQVAPDGRIIGGGYTTSPDLPMTFSYDASPETSDAFIVCLSSSGSSLDASTYLGGVSSEEIYGLAVDSSSNIYVTGFTLSTDYPTVAPYDGSFGGGADYFVSKLSPRIGVAPMSLLYSTYFGGTGTEGNSHTRMAGDIGVDTAECIYLLGNSSSAVFPLVNPMNNLGSTSGSTFLARFNTTGSALAYSTYLENCSAADYGRSMVVEPSGRVHVTGTLFSSQDSTVHELDPITPKPTDATNSFVATIGADGQHYEFWTLLGGDVSDVTSAIASDAAGNIYVAGQTTSTNLGGISPYDGSYNGGTDGFFAKISRRDTDSDGIPDYRDNYPIAANAAQTDSDGDFVGNACDPCSLTSSPGAAKYVEEFTGPLGNGWVWVNHNNPDATISGGRLSLNLSNGSIIGDKNRLLRRFPSGATVTIESKISVSFENDGDEAFIMFYGGNAKLFKLGLRQQSGIVRPFKSWVDQGVDAPVTAGIETSDPLYVRMQRGQAGYVSVYWSVDGLEWNGNLVGGKFDPVAWVGIGTVNTSALGSPSADFEYFTLYGDDIDRNAIPDQCDTCQFCLLPGQNVWTFPNSEPNVWPNSEWGTINYCSPASPCVRNCSTCNESYFPSWQTFVQAVGSDNAFFNPPTNSLILPSAVLKWRAIQRPWEGSCFGFAASNQLFASGQMNVTSELPPFNFLNQVPANSLSRGLLNKFAIYQFGAHSQRTMIKRQNQTAHVAAQQIAESLTGSHGSPHTLMLFNQGGLGARALVPTKYTGFADSARVTVLDSNLPGSTQTLSLGWAEGGSSWSYPALPGWGGYKGVVPLDPVSNYLQPLMITDTICGGQNDHVQFFVGDNDTALISGSGGIIGRIGDADTNSMPNAGLMQGASGTEVAPIGYYTPNGTWQAHLTGASDYPIWIVDCKEAAFRGGGAKSGIISAPAQNYSYNSLRDSLMVPGANTPAKSPDAIAKYDIEGIAMEADSEIVYLFEDIGIAFGDSVSFTLQDNNSVRVANCGSSTGYNIEVRVVNPLRDTSYYYSTVTLASNSSHLISPNWRTNNDSLLIQIATGGCGSFSYTSSVELPNEGVPADFVCGDADANSLVTISDAVYLINYIFSGGPAPSPLLSGDVDCNGLVTISDVVYLINYIFAGGAAPCASCP